MEQIRIVKEMREHDRSIGRTGEFVRPRYMVWENVPGVYSSNGGEDFAAVLEEAVRIAEPGFSLPRLPDKQRWTKSGGIVGDGWSVAWRTHDAQYWGVPQRRRRISMVVDFNGHTAGDILFECLGGAESSGVHAVVTYPGRVSGSEVQPDAEGVRRDPPEGGTAREETAGGAENCSAYAVRIRGGCDGGGKGALVQTEKSGTLGTGNDQTIFCLQGNGIDHADTAGCNGKGWKEDISYTLNTIDRPAVMALDCYNQTARADAFPTLRHAATDYTHIPCTFSMQGFGDYKESEIVSSCKQRDSKDATDLVISIDDEKNAYIDQFGTLKAHASGGTQQHVMERMVVRRLTPLECTRLQGYPNGWVGIGDWTDEKGRVHKEADAPKYKALGNSIALPFWRWMFGRMAAYLPEGATLGSLFDGIGGFPLCWESIHGKGTAVWASEIEPFAIAVTKHHFGGSANDR